MEYTVYNQKVDLAVDFLGQALVGTTTIQLQAKSADLKFIRLSARQCNIQKVTLKNITQRNGRVLDAPFKYHDPFESLRAKWSQGAEQHHFMRWRADGSIHSPPAELEDALVVEIPKGLRLVEMDDGPAGRARASQTLKLNVNGVQSSETEAASAKPVDAATLTFSTVELTIHYNISSFRDGLQFVGLREDDERYPHVYTKNSIFPGSACCLFPCIDAQSVMLSWDISLTYPSTLGDALRLSKPLQSNHVEDNAEQTNGVNPDINSAPEEHLYALPLSEDEKLLDMRVVCSGIISDDIVHADDPTLKTATFKLEKPVAARHVGFAIGPFEYVNLSEFRESDQDEKFGDSAVPVHGFCLPGRAEEVRNTCMPLAAAFDDLQVDYNSCPFRVHKICFVDDLDADILDAASLSICSSRLLVPKDLIDPLFHSTRELLRSVASQWIGISVVPRAPEDLWVVVGSAYFMADHYGRKLWGRNEHQYQQKLRADKIMQLDVQKPSLMDMSAHVEVAEWRRLIYLKAPLVLEILHNRLVKASGRNGINKILDRALRNAKSAETLSEGTISTQSFMKLCEKVGHIKVETFFSQWVQGSGCPSFFIKQHFNKKKLVVELDIRQTQSEDVQVQSLQSDNLQQTFLESQLDVMIGQVQPVFQGPMTVRIHEADGTPYEHIVEIKEKNTRIEIPYNTKYKRLKKGRRDKERAAQSSGRDATNEDQEDALLYCLGDTLQSQEEVNDWHLADWTESEERAMQNESYEWIRIDKDFEWIANIAFNQPPYMYVSQLQQDNDVIAQIEAMQYFTRRSASSLMSTFSVRTLMDERYFHGVRTMAADILAKCAVPELQWIGLHHLQKAFQELYCLKDSPMPRPNNFSDRGSYLLQCAIPLAMARIRDTTGKTPDQIKNFFLDKLRFNDNSNNPFSDCYYVATLLSCLASSLVLERPPGALNSDDDEDAILTELDFLKVATNEIDRYRRTDEWLPSYQNNHTVAALDCMQRLMQSHTIGLRAAEVLQFTRPGNADPIRQKGFEALAKLGLMDSPAVLEYVVQSFAFDPSPHLRRHIWTSLWTGLGHLVFSKPRDQAPQPMPAGSLIIEQQPVARAAHNQPQNITAALVLLKERIGTDSGLRTTFSEALSSSLLTAPEHLGLLDLCNILYDEVDRLVLTFAYPRMWHIKERRGAVLCFSSSRAARVRTEAIPETRKLWWKRNVPKPRVNGVTQAESGAQKRRRESTVEDVVGQPHPAERAGPKTILKLKTASQPAASSLLPKVAPSPSSEQVHSSAPLQGSLPPVQASSMQRTISQNHSVPNVPLPTPTPPPQHQPVQSAHTRPSKIIKLKLQNTNRFLDMIALHTGTSVQQSSQLVPPLSATSIKSDMSSPDVAMANMSGLLRAPVQAPQPAPLPLATPAEPAAKAPKIKLKFKLGGSGTS